MRYFIRGGDALVEIAKCGFPIRTIFDVGGHRGESIEWFAKQFKPVRVHTFEPIAEHLVELKSTVQRLDETGIIARDDVVVNEHALGREPGSREIILAGSGTHLRRPDEATTPSRTRETEVETLDRYAERNGIDRIDLLKIDVEGFELDVLSGAENSLAAKKISFIYLEVGMNRTNLHHTYYMDVLNFLEPRGFEVFGVYEQINEFLSDRPQLRRSNFCLIHRSLCDSIPQPV